MGLVEMPQNSSGRRCDVGACSRGISQRRLTLLEDLEVDESNDDVRVFVADQKV
jgi:hypothetical protein